METFADIINKWPSAAEFGRDIGISEMLARQWRNRNSIPGRAWVDVEKAAASRRYNGVTVDLLARIANRACEAA